MGRDRTEPAPTGPDVARLGPTEAAALRSLVAARLLGLLHPDLDAVSVAAVRSCARAVDEAETPGAQAYAAAVLGRLLRDTGLAATQNRRLVAEVDRAVLARAVAAELDRGSEEQRAALRSPGRDGRAGPTRGGLPSASVTER